MLHRHARDNKLIVVMAGMTFCSACKAFVPSYLVCATWHLPVAHCITLYFSQNLAKDFKDVVFLKFYGNSSALVLQIYNNTPENMPTWYRRGYQAAVQKALWHKPYAARLSVLPQHAGG